MAKRILRLEDIVAVGTARKPYCTPYGYIIDADARVLALLKQSYHGVTLAILYPEAAQAAGYEAPAIEEDGAEPNVFAYQRFELDHSYDLPVIRIATSTLTRSTLIRSGRYRPTEAQLMALLAALREMGLGPRDTLTGEEDDLTVVQTIEQLRKQPLDKGTHS